LMDAARSRKRYFRAILIWRLMQKMRLVIKKGSISAPAFLTIFNGPAEYSWGCLCFYRNICV